jgi:hypothetical protein
MRPIPMVALNDNQVALPAYSLVLLVPLALRQRGGQPGPDLTARPGAMTRRPPT